MFISLAYAQDAASTVAAQPSAFTSLFPLLLIFVIFYFLLIRPQQRKFKDHQAMIASIRRGDKVLTGGGIIGTVKSIEADENLMVEIAPGIIVKIARDTIMNVVHTGAVGETANDKKKNAVKTATANDN